MAFRGLLTAVCNSAWTGWVRDLVPQTILGQIFSKRLALATTAGMVFSLGAALFIDYWRGQAPAGSEIMGYTYVLLFGALFLGLASPTFMSLMPEPLMQHMPGQQPPLWQRLTAPVRDKNIRQLIKFLLFWGFASNLAIPFFAVYMLVRLEFPLSWVIMFSILSQLFNILFLRLWGRFVDRFGSKSVLSVCASLYLLVILGWIFTTMPERYFITTPPVNLHTFAESQCRVTLNGRHYRFKANVKGELLPSANASMASNLGPGWAPLRRPHGGFFAVRHSILVFYWIDPSTSNPTPPHQPYRYDFLRMLLSSA